MKPSYGWQDGGSDRKRGLAQQGRIEQGEGEIQVEEKRRGQGEALRQRNANGPFGPEGVSGE